MRKFIKFISISVALFLTIFSVANAQGVGSNSWFLSGGNLRPNVSTWGLLIPQLGGSGTSCVQVDNNGLFSVTGLACGSGGGGGSGGGTWATTTSLVAGRLINYPLNTTDIVVVGGVATSSATEYYFDPNTNTARLGNSNTASTTLMGNVFLPTVGQGFFYGGTNGLLQAISSSTLAGQVFPFTSVTGYNSTSTALGFLNGFFSTASSTFGSTVHLPALAPNSILTTDASSNLIATGSQLTVGNLLSTTTNTSIFNGTIKGFTTSGAGTSLETWRTGEANARSYFDGFGDLVFGGVGSSVAPFTLGKDSQTSTFVNLTAGTKTITILDASSTASGQDNEATLTLRRKIYGGSEFMDIFNDGYNSNGDVLNGLLFQKVQGGSWRDFIMGFYGLADSDPSNQIKNAQIALSISTSTTSGVAGNYSQGLVGIQKRYANAVLDVNGSTTTDPLMVSDSTGAGIISGVKFLVDKHGNTAIGTSTTNTSIQATIASSTAPQLGLSVGAGVSQWVLRNAGGNLYIATTTTTGTATSSISAFSVNSNGQITIPNLISCDTIDTSSTGVLSCGSDATGGGGGTFPFTSQVGYNSTSTVIGFNGLFSTASSTFSGAFNLPAVAPSDLLAVDSTGLVTGTSTPTFGWYNATSTTGTSTIINALQIGTTTASNPVRITSNSTSSASVTAGGVLNVTQNYDGAAVVITKNGTASDTGRTLVINQIGVNDSQDNIVASTSCPNCTDLNLKGAPTGKGILKIEHTGNGVGYSNSSALSIDLGNANDAQGLFIDATVASTTGKLLNIRNKGTEELTFTATGLLGLASTSPFATLSVNPVQGLASAQFTVGSSSATNLIVANNGNVGIATATPMSVLSVVGSEDHWGNTYHFGPVATTDFFCMKGTQCLNYAGNDNTTNGSSIEVTNINAGAHAYAFLGVGNDLFSSAGWAYAGLATNSSGYNDTGFGALFNIPNLTSLQTNLGPIGIASATSTNSFIQFATGGNDTSNERMRIINTGQIGIGTTTPFAQLDIASTTASATFKPQLALTDSSAGANLKHWTLASEGGQFYLSTSSDVYATSTASAFAVTSNGTTTVSALNILGNGNGTTTSAVGFKITSGCYAIGSTCIGSGSGSGTVNTGIAGELAWYAANGTTLSPTTTDGRLTTGAFQATSTALTNLFMNAFTGFGSTTPMAQVQIATTSANAGFRPQLVLTDANASANSKHFYVDSMSGIFDIGTTSDTGSYATASAMTISAPTTASPNTVMGVGSTTPYATLSVGDTAGQDSFAIGSSTNYFKVSKTGSVFAPNTTTSGSNQTGYWCYDSNGQFIRDTTVCLVSALKFKKDITPLNQGLSDVLKMKPVNYYLKTPLGKEDAGEQIGFVADWAESVVPDLVTHDSNGDVHGFNYEQYTAVLTKAIQELNAKIGSGKRGMEENWQNILIGLLIAGFLYQQWQIKKLKK